MNTAVQLALALGPLAVYLYVVAIWQSGHRPRIISGPIDFVLLMIGLSGLLVFGPIGHILVNRAAPFSSPSVWAWLALACSIGLIALPWLPRSYRRLTVYNVDAAALDAALRAVLGELPGQFEPTVRGFEDRSNHRGLTVETTAWFRAAVVEAYGSEPETLIRLVGRGLPKHLRAPSARPSVVAWALLGLCLAIVAPVLTVFLTRPQAREVFRVLIRRLHGG